MKRPIILVLTMTGTLIGSGCSGPDSTDPAGPASPADTPAVAAQAGGPPVAAVRPHTLTVHGETRRDDYYWMRDDDREDPEVLAYLAAENAYTQARLAHTESMQQSLYEELIERMKPDDSTVPARHGEHWYYRRYEPGSEYPIYARRVGSADGQEEILLDVNALAGSHEFYEVGSTEVSDDGKRLAYAEDTLSRGQYTIRIKNLDTGELYPDVIENASAALAWSASGNELFYVRLQDQTLIPYQVYRHTVGTDPAEDVLVYEEDDSTFYTALARSRDNAHVVLYIGSTLSTEMQLVSATGDSGEPAVFLPRESDHEYWIETAGDVAYVRTNWNAENFRLMRAPLATSTDKTTWEEIVPHRDSVFLQDFTVFDDYLVVEEMDKGITRLRVMPLGDGEEFQIDADEAAYTAGIDNNPNQDTSVLRYEYSSMATPETIYDYDMASGERVLRKQAFAGAGFDRARYATERLYAPARDGASVPVTLLFKRGLEPDGTHPLYVLGYGSYGSSYDPEFSSRRLSLVDRGFVFALAHIRGGQELGRQWYEDGKLLNKKNTFTDFIDVTSYLVEQGWGDPDRVVGAGRSAGGLLIGAVANMAPERFTVLVAGVPFVDVVTTMLDESIPLTTFEFDEWGNPKNREYYDYMLSYSPYDQVSAMDYPHLLVSAGLFDPAVQYWEPAKWVARLRATKTDDRDLLFHVNMTAGHRGSAARYERMRDYAREYAFLFDKLGIDEPGD